jgi:hypothetical protein
VYGIFLVFGVGGLVFCVVLVWVLVLSGEMSFLGCWDGYGAFVMLGFGGILERWV